MPKKSTVFDATELLHSVSFKSTPLRVLLLEVLNQASSPLPVSTLVRKTKKLRADTATVYRALLAFTEKELVRAVSVEKERVSYELIAGKDHAHHIICEYCAMIETVPFCVRGLHTTAAKKSRHFKIIEHHTMQFYGTCRKCARALR